MTKSVIVPDSNVVILYVNPNPLAEKKLFNDNASDTAKPVAVAVDKRGKPAKISSKVPTALVNPSVVFSVAVTDAIPMPRCSIIVFACTAT